MTILKTKTMRKIQYILLIGVLLICFKVEAQEKVHQTFKDTRVINTHSVETLKKEQFSDDDDL